MSVQEESQAHLVSITANQSKGSLRKRRNFFAPLRRTLRLFSRLVKSTPSFDLQLSTVHAFVPMYYSYLYNINK